MSLKSAFVVSYGLYFLTVIASPIGKVIKISKSTKADFSEAINNDGGRIQQYPDENIVGAEGVAPYAQPDPSRYQNIATSLQSSQPNYESPQVSYSNQPLYPNDQGYANSQTYSNRPGSVNQTAEANDSTDLNESENQSTTQDVDNTNSQLGVNYPQSSSTSFQPNNQNTDSWPKAVQASNMRPGNPSPQPQQIASIPASLPLALAQPKPVSFDTPVAPSPQLVKPAMDADVKEMKNFLNVAVSADVAWCRPWPNTVISTSNVLQMYKYSPVTITCWVPTDLTIGVNGEIQPDAKDVWFKTGKQGCYINENDIRFTQEVNYENQLHKCSLGGAHALAPNPGTGAIAAAPSPASIVIPSPMSAAVPSPLAPKVTASPAAAAQPVVNAAPGKAEEGVFHRGGKSFARPSEASAAQVMAQPLSASSARQPVPTLVPELSFVTNEDEQVQKQAAAHSIVRGGKTFMKRDQAAATQFKSFMGQSMMTQVKAASALPTAAPEQPHWEEFETIVKDQKPQ
jgi:hypothetical protein